MTEFGNPPVGPARTAWQSRSYLFPILVTIFCCLIGGIISIVYTAQANTAGAAGNISLAESNARTAKTWTIVSLCIGLVGIVVWFVIGALGLVTGAGQHS